MKRQQDVAQLFLSCLADYASFLPVLNLPKHIKMTVLLALWQKEIQQPMFLERG